MRQSIRLVVAAITLAKLSSASYEYSAIPNKGSADPGPDSPESRIEEPSALPGPGSLRGRKRDREESKSQWPDILSRDPSPADPGKCHECGEIVRNISICNEECAYRFCNGCLDKFTKARENVSQCPCGVDMDVRNINHLMPNPMKRNLIDALQTPEYEECCICFEELPTERMCFNKKCDNNYCTNCFDMMLANDNFNQNCEGCDANLANQESVNKALPKAMQETIISRASKHIVKKELEDLKKICGIGAEVEAVDTIFYPDCPSFPATVLDVFEHEGVTKVLIRFQLQYPEKSSAYRIKRVDEIRKPEQYKRPSSKEKKIAMNEQRRVYKDYPEFNIAGKLHGCFDKHGNYSELELVLALSRQTANAEKRTRPTDI